MSTNSVAHPGRTWLYVGLVFLVGWTIYLRYFNPLRSSGAPQLGSGPNIGPADFTWKVQDLYRAGQESRIAFAPVNTMADLYVNEQLHEREFYVPFGNPDENLRMPGAPSKYSSGGWSMRSPAPKLGQHNEEVLCGELGITPAQAAELTRGSHHG